MILQNFNYKPLPIVFSRDGHTYRLNNIPLIGTTTVINCKAKDFLMWWTVKEAYKYLQTNWDIERVYTPEEKETLLLTAKKAWTVKQDKACDSGKISHALIQESIEKGTRFGSEGIEHKLPQVQSEVRSVYSNWLAWEKTHEIVYLATELVVGSEVLWTGGTIDAIALVDGRLEILDWKSSSQLSEDVFIQTANYKFMLLEGGVGPEIGRRVIRFSKTEPLFEDHLIKSNYLKDLECFKALLTIYRWNREQKKDNYLKKNI